MSMGLTKFDMEKEATQKRIAEQLARIGDSLVRIANAMEPESREELAEKLDAMYMRAEEEK